MPLCARQFCFSQPSKIKHEMGCKHNRFPQFSTIHNFSGHISGAHLVLLFWYCWDMKVWNVGLMCICSPTDNKGTLCSACPPPQWDSLWKALIKTLAAPAERTPNMVFLVARFERRYSSGTEKCYFRLNLRDNRPPQPSGRFSLTPSLSRSEQVWFGLELAWPFFSHIFICHMLFWFTVLSRLINGLQTILPHGQRNVLPPDFPGDTFELLQAAGGPTLCSSS